MRTILFVVLLAAAAAAQAQVEARAAWARATVQGQTTAGAYMQLTSNERVSLVGVESAAAANAEIHEMRMEGKVMRMRALSRLELLPGKTTELKPGGYHIMLLELKQPLKKGEIVPIRLKLEMKDKSIKMLEVKAEVREPTAAGKHSH